MKLSVGGFEEVELKADDDGIPSPTTLTYHIDESEEPNRVVDCEIIDNSKVRCTGLSRGKSKVKVRVSDGELNSFRKFDVRVEGGERDRGGGRNNPPVISNFFDDYIFEYEIGFTDKPNFLGESLCDTPPPPREDDGDDEGDEPTYVHDSETDCEALTIEIIIPPEYGDIISCNIIRDDDNKPTLSCNPAVDGSGDNEPFEAKLVVTDGDGNQANKVINIRVQ